MARSVRRRFESLPVMNLGHLHAIYAHSPKALATLIHLDKPFDREKLQNLQSDAYKKDIPGLLVASIDNMKGS